MINLSLQNGIRKGERFQRSSTPVNLTSALGKMKAIIIIIKKAISKYLHICNKIKIMGFFQKKKVFLFMESIRKLNINETNPLVHPFPVQGVNTLPDFLSPSDQHPYMTLKFKMCNSRRKNKYQNSSLTPFCISSLFMTYLSGGSVTVLLCTTAKLPACEGRSDGPRVTISAHYFQTMVSTDTSVWDCKMNSAPEGWLLEAKLALKHVTAGVY